MSTHVAIIGGGIAGLAFALSLHRHGIACTVLEGVREVKPLGVGITLLPHAMRELAALGLQAALEARAIETLDSRFFTQHGQFVWRELRGRHAGYAQPELGIHRGMLHRVLWDVVQERLGPARVRIGARCAGVTQDGAGVEVQFEDGEPLRADIAVACDGVNSIVRRRLVPGDALAFTGINTWRGTTLHPPILGGRSYLRIGTLEVGKIVIYPIEDNADARGWQRINWTTEVRQAGAPMNDWNAPGDAREAARLVERWRFDWLDVPNLIATSERVFEYPMVDKDPLPQWTYGRITLMGDAAHPMYPRGSNGAAQGLIDARVLADRLAARRDDPVAALHEYEAERRSATSAVVLANRSTPPDFILQRVEQLTGGKPFENIDDVIAQDELRAISERYKQVAGFALPTSTPTP
jgi:5-methylphenazine-1-carboxylate 1-monooxygenase